MGVFEILIWKGWDTLFGKEIKVLVL